MSSIDGAQIEIINWDKYNARKDVKAPSWFRISHALFENPDFYDFTHSELIVWIYLLSMASKKSSATIRLSLPHADRVGKLKEKDICSAIVKLELLQALLVHVTDANADDTATASTLHNKTIHNITVQDTLSSSGDDLTASPKALFEIWNAKAAIQLPRVKEYSSKRAAACKRLWAKHPTRAHWESVIEKMNQSHFLLGDSDRGWKAGFDWLLTSDNAAKVSEGNYGGKAPAPKLQVKKLEEL